MLRCEDEGGTSVDQRIINLYDRFTHGGMSRRTFLDRLAELAGSAAAAAALLPLLQNNYAQAAIVAADDARLAAERVSYDSPKGKINGYLVRPKAKGKRPTVIVIHENRGLNPHIEDVARRLAVEGYLALAPDLLSVNGGTPPEEDKARELHTKTEREDMIAAALAAIPFMQKHAESTGKVGAVGFCFGGGVVNRMAAGSPDLAAAVPYYGLQVAAARSALPAAMRLTTPPPKQKPTAPTLPAASACFCMNGMAASAAAIMSSRSVLVEARAPCPRPAAYRR